jgi:hypothetical protein
MRQERKKVNSATATTCGTRGFIKPFNAQIPKLRAVILQIVALPQEDKSVIITR